MKPNVIYLIIDSFSYEAMGATAHRKSATPFLDQFSKKGVSFTELYAQAPFTEAALSGLICGNNPLDNHTYLHGYRHAEETIFELFQKNGYQTYNGNLYPSCNTSHLTRGIDTYYYAQEYYFDDFYKYRLRHYLSLHKKKKLTKQQKSLFGELLLENLQSWQTVLTDFYHNKHLPIFLQRSVQPYDYEHFISVLKKETEKLKENADLYLDRLFREEQSHILFQIPPLQYKKVNDITKTQVHKTYTKVLENFYEINKKANKRNNKLPKGSLKAHLRPAVKNHLLKNTREAIFNYPIFLQIEREYDTYKRSFSANKHFDHFLQWQKKREIFTPFFACLHLSDIHTPPVLFSYDENNLETVQSEFELAQEYVNELPEGFKGNLNYYLALLTLDKKLKRFYSTLKKKGLLENTVFVITSDHGSSHLDDPIRPVRVNGPYREFYHVPAIIVGPNCHAVEIEHLSYTKDLCATVAGICGISPTHWHTAQNIMTQPLRKHLTLEYLGEGCPDIQSKPIEFIWFDKISKVHIQVPLLEDVGKEHIVALFDLKEDPLELHNLMSQKKVLERERWQKTTEKAVSIVRERIEAVKREMNI